MQYVQSSWCCTYSQFPCARPGFPPPPHSLASSSPALPKTSPITEQHHAGKRSPLTARAGEGLLAAATAHSCGHGEPSPGMTFPNEGHDVKTCWQKHQAQDRAAQEEERNLLEISHSGPVKGSCEQMDQISLNFFFSGGMPTSLPPLHADPSEDGFLSLDLRKI